MKNDEPEYPESITNTNDLNAKSQNRDHIEWYEEERVFESIYEASEWAYSVPYNEIGHRYTGYKTRDPKIAYYLLFELTRANTLYGKKFELFSDIAINENNQTVYLVWVEAINGDVINRD